MKNPKKILSLALALSMTAGLFATTAFAKDADSYTDAGQINNKEAVSVLSGLGVIAGKGDGSSFDPTGNVTRAEMAKMITWAVLGDVDVSAFTGTEVPLTDLGLAQWAEGFMKYCYSQGFISGRGDGRFDPNANVTTAEAARMLLGAIGYNSEVQGYTGANWKINTIRDAQQSQFFTNLSVPADKALTRDEAAQLIYNAVQAKTIVKTPSIDRVDGKITDTYNATGPTLLKKTFEANIWIGTFEGNNNTDNAINKGSIKVTGKLDEAAESASNIGATFPYSLDISNIGEEYKVIFKDGKTGSTKEVPDRNDTIYGVYKTGNTQVVNGVKGDVKNLVAVDNKNKVKVGDSTYEVVPNTGATPDGVGVITNYQTGNVAHPISDEASGTTTSAEDRNSALTNTLKAANGDTVKLILNKDGKVSKVYLTEYKIAKVSTVTSSRITLQGVGSFNIADNNVYSGIANNDVVVYSKLYSANNDDAYFNVTKAQTAEGTLTGYKNNDNVVVGGTTYSIMNGTALPTNITDDAIQNLASDNINDTVRLYLVNGYVGAIQTISSTGGNYAIITSTDNGTDVGTGLSAKRANVLLTDGTTRTVYVHKDSTSAGTNKVTPRDIAAGKLIEYSSISNDNVIRIKSVASAVQSVPAPSGTATSTRLWNKTTKALYNQGVPANNATLFVKRNDDYYAYTLRDLGNIDVTVATDLTYAKNSDGAVVAAYAELTNRPTSSSATTRYGMIRSYTGMVNESDTTYSVYVVTVDGGNEITVKVENSSLQTGDFVKFDENTTNQQYANNDFEKITASEATASNPTANTWTKAYGRDYNSGTNLLRYYYGTTGNAGEYVGDSAKAGQITTISDVKFVFVNKNDLDVIGDNLGASVMGVDPDNGTMNLVFHTNSDNIVDVIIVETSGKAAIQ